MKCHPWSDCGGNIGDTGCKSEGRLLATNGIICFIPFFAKIILAIDPWRQYAGTMQDLIQEHLEELGFLFRKSDDDVTLVQSRFDHAVLIFGEMEFFQALGKRLPTAD